jgi:hypothetical protein
MDAGTLALTTSFPPGPLLDPAPTQTPAPPRVSAVQLKSRADEAYALHPGSCSHSVWHVIKLYLPEQTWMNANALIDHLQQDRRWREVDVSTAGELARKGELVVGGKKEATNGHVIVVYPGPDQAAGGYTYSRGGQTQNLRQRGSYPPAMSTSLGSWPGAMSRGDKTVWDPWANDARFAEVRFWHLQL